MRASVSIPELLAPAGGPEEFNAALAAGADAIYCGYGHAFNARRGAQNFDAQTFGAACDKAHLAGVRVYVTVNVVVKDAELPNVLALVRRCWILGADAFIIQDWGLFSEVRRLWPEIECHVSTQANVHDARAVQWCAEQGAARVTLSRELSLEEMDRIAQTGVELEAFCHGAICFCYSGVCQLSSTGGDRSANRGACAQPCRLPYDLVDEAGNVISAPGRTKPLCPKDYYSFNDLGALVSVGVGSLKIEGRLKGSDYVYTVVSAYRAQLDDLATGTVDTAAMEERATRLKRVFNRDFTASYLHGTSGDEMMSYDRSNNRGELVGEVVDARSLGSVKVRRGGSSGGRQRVRTSHVAEVDIALHKSVGKGDLLEVRPVQDPTQFVTTHAPTDALVGTVITCRTTRPLAKGSLVRVIRSQASVDAGAAAASDAVRRKRAVRVRIRARLGKPFLVQLATADGLAQVEVQGFVVEPARTRAVEKADLIAHVGRMGASPFEPIAFDVELDEGCGMGLSAVHRVRAQACEALSEALLAPYSSRKLAPFDRRSACWYFPASTQVAGTTAKHDGMTCALVDSPVCARVALEAGAERLYAPSDALAQGDWPHGVIPVLDEVCRESDHRRLDPWVRSGKPVAVGNISELVLACNRGARAELRPCIPVHNRACLEVLVREGASAVWLSPEVSLDEMRILAQDSPVPVGVMAFGRVRAMTSEHCVLQVAGQCVHDCARCGLRRKRLYLRNERGEQMPVSTNLQGRSRICASSVTDLAAYRQDLLQAGVSLFLADCTLLTPEQTMAAVRRVAQPGSQAVPGSTTGHLLHPVA